MTKEYRFVECKSYGNRLLMEYDTWGCNLIEDSWAAAVKVAAGDTVCIHNTEESIKPFIAEFVKIVQKRCQKDAVRKEKLAKSFYAAIVNLEARYSKISVDSDKATCGKILGAGDEVRDTLQRTRSKAAKERYR